MRRRWQIVLWIAGAAVVVPVIAIAPPTTELIINLTCRTTPPTPSCIVRMRSMGHIWAQLGSLDRAITWYRRAATEGDDPASYFHLGWAYEQRGFRNLVPKLQAHERAVDAAAAKAQAELTAKLEQQLATGDFHFNRADFEAPKIPDLPDPKLSEDFELAESAYRKAAERNFAPAMNNLGAMYVSGVFGSARRWDGVPWLIRAGHADNPFGAINLALMYSDGLGVPRDAAEATRWGEWKGERVNPLDLAYPTLERTRMALGGDMEPWLLATIREAGKRHIPLGASFKVLPPDPRMPTFRQLQDDLQTSTPQ